MIKKLIKIPIVLLLLTTVGITTFILCVNIRGNYDDYILPNGFDEVISNADSARSSDSYARIMSANLLVNYESWGGTDARRRAKMFNAVLETYSPDVVAIQEMSDQWYCCITKNSGSYKLVYPLSSGMLIHMTGLLYNSETVTLLDYGRMEYSQGDNPRLRRIVWGLFEDNATKKQYVVTSTHLDLIREGKEKEELSIMNSQAQEQLSFSKELQNRFGCPVFSCGDFNSMDNGGYNNEYFAPTIYNTITNTMTDVKYTASTTTHGDERDADAPTFDHIFLIGNAEINRYSILSDTVMQQMSDHYPIFADVSD